MKIIDDFLNSITMYRLVLYYLTFLILIALGLSIFRILPFDYISFFLSVSLLVSICWVTNTVFAKVFKVPTNLESVYITALILALIISPMRSPQDIFFLGLAAVLAMSSKYILAIGRKHIFNPAALAVFVTAIAFNNYASWWVGTFWMVPAVLLGGFLIVKKIKRFSLFFSFIFIALVFILGINFFNGNDLLSAFQKAIFDTPLLFFGFVMLTEPLTSPPAKKLQIIYGALVGFLFVPQIHIGAFYSTFEMALLIGNIYAYIVSPKEKLLLKIKEKIQLAPDIYDFVFGLEKSFAFSPGQYMEWTLGHKNPDLRGNRRYFTIASSPLEGNLRIGVKFYPNSSSYKKSLLSLNPGDNNVIAGQLAGEFTLPKDPSKKLVFIAGGIGITPFRSMIKYLLERSEKRDIVLLYSNKIASDIVYKDIFDEAIQKLGLKTVYFLTDNTAIPLNWTGKHGFIDTKVIQHEIPDFRNRIFYISGPHSMIDAFGKTLKNMGIASGQIKEDFFPGYA